MYTIMTAHFVTLFLVTATILVTPLYVIATYVFSGASSRKGLLIASVIPVWGAFAVWLCLGGIVEKLGPAGNLVIPVSWILPNGICAFRPCRLRRRSLRFVRFPQCVLLRVYVERRPSTAIRARLRQSARPVPDGDDPALPGALRYLLPYALDTQLPEGSASISS